MSARSQFIVRVTLAYIAFSALWIFFSDQMLTGIADVGTVTSVAIAKGMGFIAVTSMLLVLALRHVPSADAASSAPAAAPPTIRSPRPMMAVLVLLAASIGGITLINYRTQSAMIEEAAIQQLQAIAKANAGTIEGWLNERHTNARQMSRNLAVARLLARWHANGAREDRDQESIIGLMRSIQESYRYAAVSLWDADARELFHIGQAVPQGVPARAAVLDAARGRVVALEEGPLGATGYGMRLHVPLFVEADPAQPVLGVLVLDLTPDSQLGTVLPPWPVKSVSGETILSRRDGDTIVVLNRPSPVPVSRTIRDDPRLVGLQAHAGKNPIRDAIDYRGVRVLAASHRVGDTPWLVVAKIDESEVLAPLRDLARNTVVLLLAALAATIGAMTLLWQRHRLREALTAVAQARAIEAAETRFRATFEQAAVGIAHLSAEGRFLRVNRRLCEILGFTSEEFLARLPHEIRHPDDWGDADDVVRDLLTGTLTSFHSEKRHLRKDGSIVWLAVTTSRADDGDGTPPYLVIVAEDISARVAAEEALRKSEERFELAVRGSNDGVWDTDFVTGRIYWSPRCLTMLGYDETELVLDAAGWLARIHPDDQQALLRYRNEFIAGKRERYEAEFRLRHKDGHWVDILSRGFLMRDADGKPVRAVGTHVDISGRKAIEQALRERVNLQDYLGRIADSLPGAIISIRRLPDGALSVPFASSRLVDIYGHHPAEVHDDAEPLFARVHPEDRAEMRRHLEASAETLSAWHDECRVIHPDKGVIWVEGHSTPEREVDGSILWHGFVHDITERRRREEKLRQAMTVFESTHEAVVITDGDGAIVAINPAFTTITGWGEPELLGETMRKLQSGKHDRDFYRQFWQTVKATGYWQGEIWYRRKDGDLFPAWLGVSAVRDDAGTVVNYVGTFADLTTIKQSEKQLQHLVHYDPLTDLPNRLLLHSRVEHAIARSRRNGSRGAVLFLDLDRFKTVNESLGHRAGDALLCAVALRLTEHLRDIDTVARLGGDQFGVLLEDLADGAEARRVAEALIASLREPYKAGSDRDVYVGASIGITLFPEDGDTADQLFQNADSALQDAKASARGTAVVYTSLLTSAAQARLELDASLRRAVENEEFTLHYQPLVAIQGERIRGVEALVRWTGPDCGGAGAMMPPAMFIPIAEETGLIVPLGEWVLRTACAQMKAWLDAGLALDVISVNLSPVQFSKPDMPERIAAVLAETGLPARHLELEITEGVLLEATDENQARLARLKALGVRLAIDDFGAGYASLGYLKRLPIDKVKIDKSFVQDLTVDAADAKIVTAVIALAHSLRLEVLAEGVETPSQLAFLRHHGCDSAQGFLFSKPRPAAEIAPLVAATDRPRAARSPA